MGSMGALDGMLYAQIALFVISLMVCSLFSFIETSVSSIRLYTLKELSKESLRYKKLLKIMELSPDRILGVVLIAKNVADVLTTMISSSIISELSASWHLNDTMSVLLSIGIATGAILIFGEIIPKSIGKLHGERLFASTLSIVNILYYGFYPLSFLTKLTRFLMEKIHLFKPDQNVSGITQKEIQFLIEHLKDTGVIEQAKERMLMNVFQLDQTPVRQIMIPKHDIIALRSDTPLHEALDKFLYYQISRMLVYDEDLDAIRGVIHHQDLYLMVRHHQHAKLTDIIRPLLKVPEDMKLHNVLKEFNEHGASLAIVVNKLDTVEGLVTIKDVLSSLAGYRLGKQKKPMVLPIRHGWLVDARIDLNTLSPVVSLSFGTTQATTLSEFLIEQRKQIPTVGECIEYNKYYFHIQQVTPTYVQHVLIQKHTLIQEHMQSTEKNGEKRIFINN